MTKKPYVNKVCAYTEAAMDSIQSSAIGKTMKDIEDLRKRSFDIYQDALAAIHRTEKNGRDPDSVRDSIDRIRDSVIETKGFLRSCHMHAFLKENEK